MGRYRVTVDTGGTFSDFVYLKEETGEVSISKVPSTPDDPSRAILHGIEMLLAKGVRADDISYFCHGTTVGTNALLEGKGRRGPGFWSPKASAPSIRSASRRGPMARRFST